MDNFPINEWQVILVDFIRYFVAVLYEKACTNTIYFFRKIKFCSICY